MATVPSAWQLRVTHAGLACSLGLDATMACAAADAGLSRAAQIRSVNAGTDPALAGEPVIGHAVACARAEGLVGFAKAFQLGNLAIEDLALRYEAPPTVAAGMTALFLAVSDRFLQDSAAARPESLEPGEDPPERPSIVWRAEATRLAERLSAQPAARRLGIGGCRVLMGGHSVVARALDDAARQLASGRVSRAFVAAVDSCLEPRELRAAAAMQWLKTTERAVGFIPGEAGVCLAVEWCEPTAAGAAQKDGSIIVGGAGFEATPREAPAHQRGRALAKAMQRAAAGWRTAYSTPASNGWDLASDLNGDPRRADEWGHCLVAWQASGGMALGTPEFIASAIGECGAAGAAAQIALLLHRARRGRRSALPTLLPLSSDNGDKAALVVH